jgi:hypothetical protein
VDEVRLYIRSVIGFKSVTVIESPINNGLAKSIIKGINQIIQKYGKVIVVEDDLITAPNFLDFMNQALDFYEEDDQIQSVNGYSVFIKSLKENQYFQTRPFSWGWGTWEKYWNLDIFDKQIVINKIDSTKGLLKKFRRNCGDDISNMLISSLEGRIDSWYIFWAFNHFDSNTYSVYPKYSFIRNNGFINDATHCVGINSYISNVITYQGTYFEFIPFEQPSYDKKKSFLKYFTLRYKLKFRFEMLFNKDSRKLVLIEILKKIS